MDISALRHVPHLHHAYIVTRGSGDEIIALLESRGVSVRANPDVTVQTYADLDVDDARDISHRAALHAQNGEKFFILSFNKASHAAQNALLKVIEEAPGGSHFFLVVPQSGLLLATIRSRCIHVSGAGVVDTGALEKAQSFLSETIGVRMAIVEKMVAVLQKTHDREPARALIRSLLSLTHQQAVGAGPLRDLLLADRYLESSGSSPKLILNHIALVLPRVE
ncbi:MAG: hypothetical protein RLZZ283_511 [Candidatus Parcubacteria bacterium]|jgi:hypothetical protein